MPTLNQTENDCDRAVFLQLEDDNVPITTNIGWNVEPGPSINSTRFLAEVQVSHKQITDRFVELLTLFEEYSKMMEVEQAQMKPLPKLMRTQSETFTTAHMQAESDSSDMVKTTLSLNRMQISEATLLVAPIPKITCDMSCQTSWSAIYKKEAIPKDAFLPKPKKDDKAEQKPELPEQRTLHIEVESVSSSSALQRAPLHQRLWKVCTDLLNTIKAGVYMMGENFTYVLFVGLCLWCLYLIISHYYTFLENNMAPKKISRGVAMLPLQDR